MKGLVQVFLSLREDFYVEEKELPGPAAPAGLQGCGRGGNGDERPSEPVACFATSRVPTPERCSSLARALQPVGSETA